MSKQGYNQDYIARIRYTNALPPPPCPPKLLEIPNTGLASGQYTSAGFASRLAREQPLNIEADAELGMPVDLVGIPGVFDNDESAIQAMERPPPLHPADRALMRPPTALGKPVAGASGISFLRKTEYTTSFHTGGAKFESSNSSNTMRVKAKRRRPTDVSRDEPTSICRQILKGFNLAYPTDAYNGPDSGEKLRAADISSEERQAWKTPKHPSNPAVHLLDSYPLLPDWDAVPDSGSYQVIKFTAPPLRDMRVDYDERLDVALLRPIGEAVEDNEAYLQELEERKEDPSLQPPLPRYHFEFFLPSNKDKVRGIKRNLTTNDPENEDEISFDTGVDDDGRPRKIFKFERIRNYETANQTGDPENEYSDVVALALHDPQIHEDDPLRSSKLQKAAYFYPIKQKIGIRPRRQGHVDFMGGEPQKVDVIETTARNPEAEVERREAYRKQYDVIEA